MKFVGAHLKQKLVALALATTSAAILTYGAVRLSLFTELESVTWDARLKYIAPQTKPDPRIKIIMIDQSSIDHFSREEKIFWPWPRAIYAPVLKFLEAGGASGAALDILFTEPSSYGVEDDQTFAESMQGKLKVVVASALRNTSLREDVELGAQFKRQIETHPTFTSVQDALTKFPRTPSYLSVQMPIRELITASALLGNVSAAPDTDGIFRHTSPAGLVHGTPILSLPFALFAVSGKGEAIPGELPPLADERGRLAVRFAGPARTYATFPIAAIIKSFTQLESGEIPLIDPAEFKDALVFVGMDAPGLLDLRPTPLSEVYPGVEYNATILDNILNQRFIRNASTALNVGASTALTAIAAAATLFLTGILPHLLALLTIGAAFVLLAFHLASLGWWILMAVPLAIALFTVTLCFAYQYQLEGKQHRFIRHAFRHYVSSAVIDQIVDNPASLAIGGERRELTIFFSDIAGFTTISESLEPGKLVRLLNMFLSEMAAIIMQSGGTVDKYVGDAIVAFWNAPLAVPDHAQRGVQAALACQRRLVELAPTFEKEFGLKIKMRIGLHTGLVNVGNFGSRDRFNYTMIGDAANLASRLEGANKAFGTYILASAETAGRLPTGTPLRRVADVVVVGKKNATTVYEPLATDLSAEARQTLDRYHSALAPFESGDLTKARELFASLPNDPVAQKYLERISQEAANGAPGEGWSAEWNLTEK